MKVLVISCSLNPDSRSAILARRAAAHLQAQGYDTPLLDLREHSLPLCDAGEAYGHDLVPDVSRQIREADTVLLAVPVYNFYANAAAKNLIELTGRAWTDKIVGFLCAAGGRGSYMSVMSLGNSLMLDFRCLIVPRFVYATNADFEDDQPSAKIEERIEQLGDEAVRIARALRETAEMR